MLHFLQVADMTYAKSVATLLCPIKSLFLFSHGHHFICQLFFSLTYPVSSNVHALLRLFLPARLQVSAEKGPKLERS